MKLQELHENKKRIIYLDLDGVLADFDSSVKRHTGKYPHEQSDDEMWKSVEKDEHFYSKLDKMSGADKFYTDILAMATNHGFTVKILTAIPRKSTMPEAGPDKIKWVKKNFGNIDVVLGPYSRDKWKHAQPGDILIDDRKSNIDEWKKKGNAIGILYKNANDALSDLKSIIKGEK